MRRPHVPTSPARTPSIPTSSTGTPDGPISPEMTPNVPMTPDVNPHPHRGHPTSPHPHVPISPVMQRPPISPLKTPNVPMSPTKTPHIHGGQRPPSPIVSLPLRPIGVTVPSQRPLTVSQHPRGGGDGRLTPPCLLCPRGVTRSPRPFPISPIPPWQQRPLITAKPFNFRVN